jgi:hypothetical protein
VTAAGKIVLLRVRIIQCGILVTFVDKHWLYIQTTSSPIANIS